ncbi:MAG: heavy-metal-associated domain-containing protein [Chitinophagales bacterium]|nr:heavy-metal-associated domain-containing protein [Chitinophagales bacterium]HPW86118.1 heavy-metal-associated domain-containing protein [Chitinophagales bacterium]HQO89526.1 heavy-metal-associated domain-containing protein [Chitinophagales bacterium]
MNTLKSIFVLAAISVSSLLMAGTLNLNVKGMHCGGCETKFKSNATSINGIQEVSAVSAEKGTATIEFDEKVISAEKAIEALAQKTGYTISAVTKVGEVKADGTPAGCCTKGNTKAACKKGEEAAKCTKTKPACNK